MACQAITNIYWRTSRSAHPKHSHEEPRAQRKDLIALKTDGIVMTPLASSDHTKRQHCYSSLQSGKHVFLFQYRFDKVKTHGVKDSQTLYRQICQLFDGKAEERKPK